MRCGDVCVVRNSKSKMIILAEPEERVVRRVIRIIHFLRRGGTVKGANDTRVSTSQSRFRVPLARL
jgi:hypothetical protein